MKALIQFSFISLISTVLCLMPVSNLKAESQELSDAERRRSSVTNPTTANPGVVTSSSEETASGVYYDSEGYAVTVRKEKTTGAKLALTGDFLALVMLLGVGAYIGTIWKYRKWTMDMKIATAAAAIMTGAVIYAITQARSKITDKEYKIEIREDGTVNNMQADAIREQAKSYRTLESLAGIKWKIEAAGAAAFTAAAVVSVVQDRKLKASQAACTAAVAADVTCPGASGAVMNLNAAEAGSGVAPSGVEFTKIMAANQAAKAAITTCTTAKAPCLAATIEMDAVTTGIDQASLEASLPAAQMASVIAPTERLHLADVDLYQSYMTGMIAQNEINELWSFESRNFPYESLFLAKSSHENFALTSYLQKFEEQRFYQGELSSLTIDKAQAMGAQANTYMDQKLRLRLSENTKRLQNILLDWIFPSAQAWTMKEFGLAGGVAVAAAMMFRKQAQIFDRWMAVPRNRQYVFAGSAAIATAAAVISKKSEGTYKENAEKLEGMLKEIERLQGMPLGYTAPPKTSTGFNDGLTPRNVQSSRLALDGGKTSCMIGQPTGSEACRSFESEIKKETALGDMGDTMANLATLTGSTADGFMGTDSLSGATLDNINQLAASQAVADEALRQARDSYNKLREKNGEKPLDFVKLSSDFLDGVKKATIRNLEEDANGSRRLMASLGGAGNIPLGKPIEEKAAESVESAIVDGKGVAAGNKAPEGNFDFSFGFDDSGNQDDLLANAVYGDDGMLIDIKNDFESTDDIVSNRDVSLFQIISVRYLKSGFPRLFELKE